MKELLKLYLNVDIKVKDLLQKDRRCTDIT